MDTLTTVLLPDFGGARSWRQAGPVLLPREHLPACAPVRGPGADWQESRVTVNSSYLVGRISVGIPAEWRLSFPQPGRNVNPSWSLIASYADGARTGGLTIWVSPHAGYSSVGVDSATRQLALAECVADGPGGGVAVATFETTGWNGHEWHVEAVTPAGPSRWLKLHASTHVAAEAGTLRAVVTGVHVEGP